MPRAHARGTYRLEEILQRKLHNSWIPRRSDLTECVAIDVRGRVVHVEAVRNIERLSTKFHLLAFTELERPRNGKVDL